MQPAVRTAENRAGVNFSVGPGVNMLARLADGRKVPAGEPVVDRRQRLAPIRTLEQTAIGRGDVQSSIRDGQAFNLVRGNVFPFRAAIQSAIEAAAGARENHLGMLRVLRERVGAPRSKGDPAHLRPKRTTIGAAPEAAARPDENARRLVGIDAQGDDVRIRRHAICNQGPVCSSVGCLPGKARRAGVKHIAVVRIKRHRNHRLQFDVSGRRDRLPCGAAVMRQAYTVAHTHSHHMWILTPNRQGIHFSSAQAFHGLPRFSAVVCAVQTGQSAVGHRRIDHRRVRRIHYQHVEHG